LSPVVVAVVVFGVVSDFVAAALPVAVVEETLTLVLVAVVDPMDVRLLEVNGVPEVLDSADVANVASDWEWELV
jgi:predicted nucleotidyltransferase